MKRILAMLLALSLAVFLVPVWIPSAQAATDSRVEKAISWAISIANDNKHGYSQYNRNGPDYDCSSFVSTAFHQAGFNVSPNYWTGNLESAFKAAGFKAYAAGSVTLQRGDILLVHSSSRQHVELYIGNNQCVAAHCDENGGIGGKTGDQTGKEIDVRSKAYCDFCNYKQYTRVLRYGDGAATPKVTQYFDCDVKITTTKGKTVNAYKNPLDSSRLDYFDQGQTLYSTKGAKASDGSTWYQVQAMQGSKVVAMWINAGTSGVKVTSQTVSNGMSFSPSSLTLEPGGRKMVSINFKGDGIHTLNWSSSNSDVCTASWGNTDWNKGTSSLTVTGNRPGTATMMISFLDKDGKKFYSKSFDVTVSTYNTILSVDPSAVYLDLTGKASETVTLSWGGTYPGDGYIDTTLEGVAKAALVENSAKNGQAQMKIFAEEAGTGTVTFRMNGRSTPGVFATATVNVTAVAPTYTISYNANGGSGAPAQQTKSYNKPLALSNQKPTRTGYTFVGWLLEPESTNISYLSGDVYNENWNLTLYAGWEPATGVKYTVEHYLVDSTGTHLGATDVLEGRSGETVWPPTRNFPGYESPLISYAEIEGDGSTVVKYKYFAKVYEVVLQAGKGIDYITGGGPYRYGDTVTINAQAAEGYTWAQWTGGFNTTQGSLEQTYTFIMPDKDVVLTATATEIPEPDCSVGHTWGVWTITEEPTCEQNGARQRSCEVCGHMENEMLNAFDHDWGQWDITKEASCAREGQKQRICQNCGKRESETIARLEHDYQIDGETDEKIYYICANCGETYAENRRLPGKDRRSLANFIARDQYQNGLFADVDINDWFEGNVAAVYELGLMRGTGSGTFSPGNNVTLAEAVTLAARLHSIYYTGEESFPGYDGGNWYDPYVDYAKENGLISTNYLYTKPATREEFVHILAQALPEEALEHVTGRAAFADDGDIVYISDVELLQRAGIINGIPENGQICFKPAATITRAEVAAIVGRMAQPSIRMG